MPSDLLIAGVPAGASDRRDAGLLIPALLILLIPLLVLVPPALLILRPSVLICGSAQARLLIRPMPGQPLENQMTLGANTAAQLCAS